MSRITVNGVTLNVTELPQRQGRGALSVPGLPAGLPARATRGLPAGMPIVMIHGLAASQAFWYAAGVQFLSLLGPCLMYDLRGHGKSEAPETGYGVGSMAQDLAALLDDRGMTRVHLIAHSFGGMIALTHALRHPESVASLTLVDCRIRPIQKKLSIPVHKVPPGVERKLAALGLDLAAINDSDDGVDYLRTVAKIEVGAGEEAAELLAELYRHPRLFRSNRNAQRWIDLTERVSLMADLAEEAPFSVEDLRGIELPLLILAGGLSTTLPSAREMARLCPQAIFHEVPEVGHFFPMSQPRLFLQPTLRFLRAVAQGRLSQGRRHGVE